MASILPKVGFSLVKWLKSLLPGRGTDREALNSTYLKTKPRLPENLFLGSKRLKRIFGKLSLVGVLGILLLAIFPEIRVNPFTAPVVFAHDWQKPEVLTSGFSQPISLPHPGYLTTSFSNWHPGIDIATGLGMPVHPIMPGVIEGVNFSFLGYGNHVTISHQQGFTSLYAHMGRVFVKKGQTVSQTTILGEVGLTGFTSGPHTHLEVTKDGEHINPLSILPPLNPYPDWESHQISGGPNIYPIQTNLHKNLKVEL